MTVRREYIDKWVNKNGPDGVVKLALKAKVSSSLIQKVRNGKVPKHEYQLKICNALCIGVEDLFPTVGADEEEAS